jgi:hypothetical protein
MGKQVDADAELRELASLFEDLDVDAGVVKELRGSEAAGAGPDDDDGHALPSLRALMWSGCHGLSIGAADLESQLPIG